MRLDKELKEKIRKIFEGPRYYGRKLTDAEVEEIAANLLNFANVFILKKIKN